MNDWLQLLGGGVLLYLGAEWLVAGATTLAFALRVPRLLVGLTVVAYGTSAPEIIVGIEAAATGHGDVALGNIIGSNIANIGLILGATALIEPPRVDGALRWRELPVLLASTALLPLVLLDGSVRRSEGAALVLAAVSYTAWMLHSARRSATREVPIVPRPPAANPTDASASPTRKTSARRAILIAVVGLLVLLFGGQLFIQGAVALARALGTSDRLIGLTLVAVGTSLPELVTGVVAARRGQPDLAIGNVVGSNIFNLLLCLGSAALTGSIHASIRALAADLAFLCLMTLLLAGLLRAERTVSRREGALVLTLYACFVLVAVAQG